MARAVPADFRVPLVAEETLVELGAAIPVWRRLLARWMFSEVERLNFYRALGVYRSQDVRENAALVNWWNVITQRGSRNSWHPLAVLIPLLLHAMHYRGQRWQALFQRWVPSNDAMIIAASEHAGLTPVLLKTLLETAAAQRQWDRKIRSALMPALLNFLWVFALLAGVGLYYFPALRHSMPNMRITGGVAQLAQLSRWITEDGVYLAAAFAAAPFLLKAFLRNATGAMRLAIDALPGFSLYRQATGMTFLLGISALLEAGENFIDAVLLLRRNASPYVRERLDAILAFDNLRPAEAMAATGHHWPDDATIELLTLYMVTRTPQDGIKVIVQDWFEKAGDAYARIAATINTLGQILTWGIVGWLYLVTSELTATMTR